MYLNPSAALETVQMSYNSQGMGLPASMTSDVTGNPNPVYDTTYNEWGELTSLRQGSAVQSNLLTTQFAYNVRGWLTNTLATTTNGTQTLTHLNMVYGYDANGNVKSLTNTAVSSPNSTTNPTFSNAYSYDWLDRLASGSSTSVGIGGASLFPTESYSYDNLDRMTTRSIGGVLYPYAYTDPAHKDAPTSYHNNSYTYDANGDQLTGTVNGSSQSRTYDQERRLVQITYGSTTLTFIYDGVDKRIVQNVTTGATTTHTLYIGSFYEETLTGGSNPPYIVYYILGSKMVGMRRANQPGVNTNGQFRVVGDQLGSTTLIIDTAPTPNVTQREYYKPFGEVAFTSGSSRTDKGFTGQRLDASSGLMYYGARYYDPVLSYFISADPTVTDPSNPLDYNRYLYVRGNPLGHIDPSGYGPEDYYIFVQGCISTPCNRNSPDDWGEYGSQLHSEYNKWVQKYQHLGESDEIAALGGGWEDWAARHTRSIGAGDLLGGADAIRTAIAGIKDDDPGVDIHLLGHSMGGGAIAQYILDAAAGIGYDSRVKSAVLIDAPLVDHDSSTGYRLFGSRIKNLGAAASKLGINVLAVDTPNDFVSHPSIHGIREVTDPHYPKGHGLPMPSAPNPDETFIIHEPAQERWHDHTSRYMATETQDFLEQVWK